MKNDQEIQKAVMDQLNWEPLLNSSQIGVSVKNGIVTLSGEVDAYLKRTIAEKAAKKVSGVKAIAEDIHVGISPDGHKTDAEIAEAVLNSLKWNTVIPDEQIKIRVEKGNVRLEGEVEWQYQRVQAASAIEHLAGIRSVTNLIRVKPKVTASDVEHKIQAAFRRSAMIDAGKIITEVSGNRVTLRGEVRSFDEKEAAENAAWSAPGVQMVISMLEIKEPEFPGEESGQELYADYAD